MEHNHDTPTTAQPTSPEQPAEPTPPKSPEQRINDVLTESNRALLPVLIAPVSKTPVPIVDFLAEYISGGWTIDWRLAEQRN